VVDHSFNSISIDGVTSTNDTIVAFANGTGMVGGAEINEAVDVALYVAFRDELTRFVQELVQFVVHDGEGVTKFVTISVEVLRLHPC